MRVSFSFFGVFLSFLCGCASKSNCDIYCSVCVSPVSSLTTQQCYEYLVLDYCAYHFDVAMDSINSTDWCSLERVKSAYNNFTVCTEIVAECLLIPWPNKFVESIFVDIHTTYFQDCSTEALRDPPPSIILALVMTPICLIPAMDGIPVRDNVLAQHSPAVNLHLVDSRSGTGHALRKKITQSGVTLTCLGREDTPHIFSNQPFTAGQMLLAFITARSPALIQNTDSHLYPPLASDLTVAVHTALLTSFWLTRFILLVALHTGFTLRFIFLFL
ncbi:hypothetical protein PO909_001413 [Leuciscus waleckii]